MSIWNMSYDDYLRINNLTGTKDDYIDFLVDCCGMTYMAALREANDLEFGYEE